MKQSNIHIENNILSLTFGIVLGVILMYFLSSHMSKSQAHHVLKNHSDIVWTDDAMYVYPSSLGEDKLWSPSIEVLQAIEVLSSTKEGVYIGVN